MQYAEIIDRLESMADPVAVQGMARYGINTANARGITIPSLRKLAREAGTDPSLARQLWASGIHEARILACLIDDPEQVAEPQLEEWALGFDSWDVCDACCSNLFDKTRFARQKAAEWSLRPEEFVKRAGFVLMAALAVHDKHASDDLFLGFLQRIKSEAGDERNFVQKAVNWALRQIGKRNIALNRAAIQVAHEIYQVPSRSARWVASDALRELTGVAVQHRLSHSD